MAKIKISRKNFSESISEEIRKQILNLEINPGARLTLEDYAKLFGVSRTPVRDALKELSKEGFVVYDGKSYYVHKHSISEIKDIFVVRRSLEMTSVEQAAQRRSEDDVKTLHKLCNKAEEYVETNDLDSFINYDKVLHNTIVACSHNKRLISLMSSINDECWWINKYIFIKNPIYYSLVDTFNAHKEIIIAIENKDAKTAVQLMEKHITDGEKRKFNSLSSGSNES